MAALGAAISASRRAVAETVDRVVASIGNIAITESEVEAEYRFELFLNGRAPGPPPNAATLHQVRDRLIEQKLLAEEAATESTQVEDPPPHVPQSLNDIRQKFGTEEAFQTGLGALGKTEDQVRDRLANQEKVLLMIDQRFRASAWPEASEMETYYRETFVPEYSRLNKGPAPPLAEVESTIREILIERKIDRFLEAWLAEMKSIRRVKVHAF